MNSHFAFDDQSPTDCETWRQLSPEGVNPDLKKTLLQKRGESEGMASPDSR